MSWNSKQKRKAQRGNKTALNRLNKALLNEKNRENALSRVCGSSLARTQAEKQGVCLLSVKPQRDFKALDTASLSNNRATNRISKNREIAILKSSFFSSRKASFKINKDTWKVEQTGKDYIKITGLKAWTFQQKEVLNAFK